MGCGRIGSPVARRIPDDDARRTNQLIEMLGLSDLEGATWRTMPQGERRRTLIARSLLPEPQLLLLDEPSTGSDVAAREQFLATVDELHRAQPHRAQPLLATVLVTHHPRRTPQDDHIRDAHQRRPRACIRAGPRHIDNPIDR